jgi:16S rRNA (adenine1518-N6/adenine1519-N6)-dimethyltransferase
LEKFTTTMKKSFAKKSLGQHFLTSTRVVGDIVRASGTKKGDTVLEIGPGGGILTEALLSSGAKVVAIEKDDRLIPILEQKFKKEIALGTLELIHADILHWNMSRGILDTKYGYKVVANIPYYITGQIIRMFLESQRQPISMTLLVQKEVADRIVAKDGKESLLSLSVKAFGRPKLVRTVGRGSFSPAPNVDSAVLHISDISNHQLKNLNQKLFFQYLHAGFAHKRKLFISNLSSLHSKSALSSAFALCHIDPKSRAEDISLNKWLSLFIHLNNIME